MTGKVTTLVTGAGDAVPGTSLAVPGTCALVVGTGTHAAGSLLPDIPAVAATVTAVGAALVQRCGLAEDQVATLTDPADPRALLRALTEAAAAARDVLLFYYVGHGLVSIGGELYLATSATTDQGVSLAVEALSYATVRDVLATCAAKSIVVVLDCCFSGRAYGAFGTAVADAFELSYVRGSFLLTAASATELALAPAGEQYTGFSGALLGLLTDGDPAAPRHLSMEDAYRYLSRVLPQRGLPAPHRRAGDRGGDLILATNPLAPPVTQPRRSSEVPDTGAPARPRPCPYPGLSAFTAADARYFRGRDDLVADALAALATRTGGGPAALIGPSGSGKSSLLQAGLLPAVRAGRLSVPGSADWPQLLLTPGEHPLRTLATRLAGPVGGSAEGIQARLAADPAQLTDIARRARPDGLLVCADQFEELFTVCTDLDERRAFVRALCAASDGPDAPLVVVLGIRADFYGHCMAYPELASTLEHGQIPVRPMSTDQLRTAIEGPADTAGLVLESGLADRLLQDLAAEPDAGTALPFLSYALQATWRHSDGQLLTLADYQATGGIWQAVTQRADRSYDELDPAAQDAARTLLLTMVRLGEGTEDVRRPVSVVDLMPDDDPSRLRAIAAARDAFVEARLVTVTDGEAEITHEALLRAWPRLRGWIDEDRSELLARQRLADAAHTWAAEGRDRGTLYSGARLELTRRWLDPAPGTGQRGSLGAAEREFLAASITAERYRRRRRRTVAAAAVVAVLALAGTGVFAIQQRAGDRSAAAQQSSVQLAAEADALRASDPAAALELSLTAYSTAATPQARSSLYESYVSPFPVSLPGGRDGPVDSVAYGPGGGIVAGAFADGQIRLWRVSNPLHPVLVAELAVDRGDTEIAFAPKGHLLYVHAQRALEIWNVADPERPVRLSAVAVVAKLRKGRAQLVPLAVSPGGDIVATGNGDGRLRLWDVADPRHPVLDADLLVGRQAVNSVAFSPSGVLATASAATSNGPNSGRVRLWDVTVPRSPRLVVVLTVSSALSVAFSPLGHLLVAAGAEEDLHAWTVADPADPIPVSNDSGLFGGPAGTDSIVSVAFRPDARAFVTADTGGQTYIWSATDPEQGLNPQASLPDSAGSTAAAYSPNGQQLVTGDLHGTTVLWTTLAPLLPGGLQLDWQGSSFGQHGTLLAVNAPTVNGKASGRAAVWNISDPTRPTRIALLPRSWPTAEFLPDGRTLLTANLAKTEIRLWDATNPRHLVAGAILPVAPVRAPGAVPIAPSGGHLLAVLSGTGTTLGLWNVQNYRHPVLVATIPAGPQMLASWFITSRLLGIVAWGGGLQLWDVTKPRHPVRDGYADVGVGDSILTYEPASRVLTAESINAVSGSGTSLWSLANPRKPKLRKDGFDADPNALGWIDGQELVAINADNTELDLWRVDDGLPSSVLAATPIGSQILGTLQVSPDAQLFAAGYTNASIEGGQDTVQLWSLTADHRALADFAALPGDSVAFAFAPGSQTLAAELTADLGQQLAFAPGDTLTAVYPLSEGALYSQLCQVTMTTGVGSGWQRYLPDTYYRSAC
jgi:WD40 repeat protein